MRSVTLLSLALVTACDGGMGGASDSTKLVDLTPEQLRSLCLEFAQEFPTRTITCSGQEQTIGIDGADCDMPNEFDAACQATVGQMRACIDAIASVTDARLCEGPQPPECALPDC